MDLNKDIRLIVTDLDNTLLSEDKTISSYTAAVFNQCMEKGYMTAFATARPKRASVHYRAQIPFTGCICHNGAQAFTPDGKYSPQEISLPEGYTKSILTKILNQYPAIHIATEIDDMMYINVDAELYWPGTAHIRTKDFADLPAKEGHKILIQLTSAEEHAYVNSLLNEDVYGQIHEQNALILMHKNATKINAVKALCTHFGITPEQVLAFGDDHNDAKMLSECGIGVAMGNAIDEVKGVADYITGANSQDGVAKFLEQHLL